MRNVGPQGAINEKTYTSEGALTRGYAVTGGVSDGDVAAITALGQPVIGIVSIDISGAGFPAPVVRLGDCPAIAGAAIAYGAKVKPDAAGRMIPAAAGDQVAGRAENTATGLGDEFIVFVCPGSM